MKTKLRWGWIPVFLICLWGGVAAAAQDEFRWQGSVSPGGSVEIKGVNGEIAAVAGSGPEVVVTASKSGRRSDPASVVIRVVEHEGGVTICAVYPSENSARPNECRPGSGGRNNSKNNDVRVNFRVTVPNGVGFIGRNVNGGVRAESLTVDTRAYTVNGSIRVSTRGLVEAKTVNGSITASMGTAAWSDSLSFETVNGDIELRLPASTNADVEVRTVNGRIQTNLPLTLRGTLSRRNVQGTLGRGGPDLLLKTVNGNVRLDTL